MIPYMIPKNIFVSNIFIIIDISTFSDIRIGSISAVVDKYIDINVPNVIILVIYRLVAKAENPHCGIIPNNEPIKGPYFFDFVYYLKGDLSGADLVSCDGLKNLKAGYEKIDYRDEDDLLLQLRPNIDGVVIRDGNRQGLFLPSVWEQISDRRDFLNNLKLKAGMSPSFWSNDIQVYRFRTVEVKENGY